MCGIAVLTWALYFLADNKEVQEKAYDELQTVLEGQQVTPDAIPHLV